MGASKAGSENVVLGFLEFQVLGNSWFVRSKPKLYILQQKVSVFCS